MPRRRLLSIAVLALVLGAVFAARVPSAFALDAILFEELKEMAIEYGKISQRFVTCKVKPPYSVKIAFLNYARYQGATAQHIDILTKLFDEGAARVRDLRTGFSPEECKEKLESPEGKKLLAAIRKWGPSPGGDDPAS